MSWGGASNEYTTYVFVAIKEYSEPSLQRHHLFPKILPLKWICCCKEFLTSRMICNKCYVLFIPIHRMNVLDICWNLLTKAILIIIQNICCLKYWIIMFLHNFWFTVTSLEEGFHASQVVSIRNFVVVSSVGIKRVDCINNFQKKISTLSGAMPCFL